MNHKLIILISLFIFTFTGIQAQLFDEKKIEHIEHGGMIIDFPEDWKLSTFRIANGNYGIYSDKKSGLLFAGFSLEKEFYEMMRCGLFKEGWQNNLMKRFRIKISSNPKVVQFNNINAEEYILTGSESRYDLNDSLSGRVLIMEDQDRYFILIYCMSNNLAKDYDFIRMLESFDIDRTWVDTNYTYNNIFDAIVADDSTMVNNDKELARTEDGYLIYDEEGISFELSPRWKVKYNMYSPKNKCNYLFCNISSTSYLLFMMYENKIMSNDSIHDTINESEENKTNKPVEGLIAGLKTKEYESEYDLTSELDKFKIPSECDLPRKILRGRYIYFNDDNHNFFIYHQENVSQKENDDFKRVLNTFKITARNKTTDN